MNSLRANMCRIIRPYLDINIVDIVLLLRPKLFQVGRDDLHSVINLQSFSWLPPLYHFIQHGILILRTHQYVMTLELPGIRHACLIRRGCKLVFSCLLLALSFPLLHKQLLLASQASIRLLLGQIDEILQGSPVLCLFSLRCPSINFLGGFGLSQWHLQ